MTQPTREEAFDALLRKPPPGGCGRRWRPCLRRNACGRNMGRCIVWIGACGARCGRCKKRSSAVF